MNTLTTICAGMLEHGFYQGAALEKCPHIV